MASPPECIVAWALLQPKGDTPVLPLHGRELFQGLRGLFEYQQAAFVGPFSVKAT